MNQNSKILDYTRQLEQLYSGGSWNGESYHEKLKHVDAEIAFSNPVAGVHSIAEIVWHVIYWRTCCVQWLEGNSDFKENTVERLNFLPTNELKLKGWSQLRSEFDETQKQLTQLLSVKDDAFLELEYLPNFTYNFLMEGLIHHDIYHLGQIGLVIKIISIDP